MQIAIMDWMIEAAKSYAILSAAHTSNRHDFHEGGLAAKARKMFEGKLAEKVFRQWLEDHAIPYQEDATPHTDADIYDFLVGGRTIDVKAIPKDSHTRLLEMVHQFARKPKDYYIAIRLRFEPFDVFERDGQIVFDFTKTIKRSAEPIGWASRHDIATAPLENVGYSNNYRLWLSNLRKIEQLVQELQNAIKP